MNKRGIIIPVNLAILCMIIGLVYDTSIISYSDKLKWFDEGIDINNLIQVIRHTKAIMYLLPLIILLVGSIILFIQKPVIIYISSIMTLIAFLILVTNVFTFSSKILSEDNKGASDILDVEVKLVLDKIDNEEYETKSEYLYDIIDLIR